MCYFYETVLTKVKRCTKIWRTHVIHMRSSGWTDLQIMQRLRRPTLQRTFTFSWPATLIQRQLWSCYLFIAD